MKTTFILAQKFNVTPFEIMAQEIDAVIMVINHFITSAEAAGRGVVNSTIDEKEQAKGFWACM